MPDLLIELLSEEIPARMQPRARADLKRLVTNGLVEAGLTYSGAESFSTPRRLTLAVQGLADRSPMTREERRGPREGAPDRALEGFARSAGVPREALELRREAKGAFHYATVVSEGRTADAIVAEVLEAAIRGFPWPKSMRWGEGSLRWVRPLRRILCLLSDEAGPRVVPVSVDGILGGDVTERGRTTVSGEFRVASFEDYVAILRRAHVTLDPAARAETILSEARTLAFAQGLELVEDDALLEEVTGLAEWPVVLMGDVGEFQDLPAEVLRTSMRTHQKFFSVRDQGGRIVRFVTVADGETTDDGATVLAGNRKVLAARLSDARFFWENDLAVARAGMEEWRDKLGSVTYHAKLGSQADRIERIAALAREIAPAVGADPDLTERAARVAKLDLASDMVGEFPELQGVMGRRYAEAAGEPAEVAAAAEQHYAPMGPSDVVPASPVSVAVALADKIDALAGLWWVGERPTGSKDPYALRRAALGVIRLVTERGLRLSLLGSIWAVCERLVEDDRAPEPGAVRPEEARLAATLEAQFAGLEGSEDNPARSAALDALLARTMEVDIPHPGVGVLAFVHDRLKVHLRDRGVRHDVIDASLAMPASDDLALLVRRAEALRALLDTPDGGNLVQGFRRANNILTQAEERDGAVHDAPPDPGLADAPEERALFEALDAAEAQIVPAMEAERFEDAMHAMARLRGPIDAFFEAVQVNAKDPALRANRLGLLARIRGVCLQVADLSRLEG